MDDNTKAKLEAHMKETSARALGHSPDSLQSPHMAAIQIILAEEHLKAVEKMERQTNKLIGLTWALVGLTVALLFFTIVLYKDTHQMIQSEKLTNDGSIQKH